MILAITKYLENLLRDSTLSFIPIAKKIYPRQSWWCWEYQIKPFYGSPNIISRYSRDDKPSNQHLLKGTFIRKLLNIFLFTLYRGGSSAGNPSWKDEKKGTISPHSHGVKCSPTGCEFGPPSRHRTSGIKFEQSLPLHCHGISLGSCQWKSSRASWAWSRICSKKWECRTFYLIGTRKWKYVLWLQFVKTVILNIKNNNNEDYNKKNKTRPYILILSKLRTGGQEWKTVMWRTDGWMDRTTDTANSRVACPRLKESLTQLNTIIQVSTNGFGASDLPAPARRHFQRTSKTHL